MSRSSFVVQGRGDGGWMGGKENETSSKHVFFFGRWCVDSWYLWYQTLFVEGNLTVDSCDFDTRVVFYGEQNNLDGGFKHFLFSPLPGETIQFDYYFSDGLKPPTSNYKFWHKMMGHSKREGFNDQLGPVAPVNLLFLMCFKSSALWDENGTSETKRPRVCTLVSRKHVSSCWCQNDSNLFEYVSSRKHKENMSCGHLRSSTPSLWVLPPI